MYTFSLVANSFSLPYLEEVVKKINIVFRNKVVTNDVLKCYDWLQKQFNLLNVYTTKNEQELLVNVDNIIEEQADSEDDSEVESNTEINPFKDHFKKCLDNINIQNGTKNNPLYCPEAVAVLMNKWIPTVPFWSSLLLGKYCIA